MSTVSIALPRATADTGWEKVFSVLVAVMLALSVTLAAFYIAQCNQNTKSSCARCSDAVYTYAWVLAGTLGLVLVFVVAGAVRSRASFGEIVKLRRA